MKDQIKIGYCVAYDWYFLKYSIPLIYRFADRICLSLDKDRISWSGNKYVLDEQGFKRLLQEVDVEKKIFTVEENYHQEDFTPMQNEVYQRNRIAEQLGKGGWHIQLDCDEYFLQFEEFVNYLHRLPKNAVARANVSCPWIVLYKQLEDGFLCIDPIKKENIELIQIASKDPIYEYGRRNGNFNLVTNFKILHQSWARTHDEISEKINNWGHSIDFDKHHYLKLWESLNSKNFATVSNLHHLKPEAWPKLRFIKARSLVELIQNEELQEFPKFSRLELFFLNSKFFSRARKLWSYLNKL